MKKIVIITGANGQVGSYLARHYFEQGYPLILLYHQRTERIGDLISLPLVYSESVELIDLGAIREAVESGIEFLGAKPGVLIHTASLRSYDAAALHDGDPEVWKTVFDTNLRGAYYILRATLPFFIEEKWGRIVMFGSDVTRVGLPRGSAYAASKAAIVNLVKTVAQEIAPYNVLINAISPGPIETNLAEDYTGEYLEFRKAYFAKHTSISPTHKLITIKEIEMMIAVLISDQNQNITGEEIFINGGNR